MDDDIKPCRSIGPSGQPCERQRGHDSKPGRSPGRSRRHVGGGAKGREEWTGGINTPARRYEDDDGYMTEADEMTWGRL